jgi:hypothetical protein
MADTTPPGRGRPRKPILERDQTGIAFIDCLKGAGHPELVGRLDEYLEAQVPHCPVCNYDGLVAEAQRCLKTVHGSTLKAFEGHYGGSSRGKRQLVGDLMAPWMDESQSFPFNLNPDEPKRYVPPGLRGAHEHVVRVDAELADSKPGPDAVDYDLVGYPKDPSRYSLRFGKNHWGERVIDHSTMVYAHEEPMDEENWGRFKLGLEKDLEVYGWMSGHAPIPIDLRRSLHARSFLAYRDEQVEQGRFNLQALGSRDFLDRGVTLTLVREAQGAGTPERVKETGRFLCELLGPEIEGIAGRFFRGRLVASYNKWHGGELPFESVLSAATEIGSRLIVGERPEDLKTYLARIGEKEVYEYLQTRRLDQILRYHIELNVYFVTLAFVHVAIQTHASHSAEAKLLESRELTMSLGECLEALYQAFAPYSWVYNNQRVLNLTSPAAIRAFSEALHEVMAEGTGLEMREMQQAAVNRLSRRYGIRFSPEAYDPGSGEDIITFLRAALTNKLKQWMKHVHGWPSGRRVAGGRDVERIVALTDGPAGREPTEEDLGRYGAETGATDRDLQIIRMNLVEGYRQDEVAADPDVRLSRRQVNRIVASFKKWRRQKLGG